MISVQNHPQPLSGNKVKLTVKFSFLYAVLFLLIPLSNLNAQTPLADAWKAFAKANYEKSISLLKSENTATYSIDQLMVLIKSYNRLNQFSEAVSIYEKYPKPEAEGVLLQEYFYEAGTAYWGNYNYQLALRTWLTAYDLNVKTGDELAKLIRLVVMTKLTMADLYSELGVYPVADNTFIQELLAEKAKGQNQAENLFSWFTKRKVSSERIDFLRQLQVADDSKSVKKVKIGLLLPLDEKSRTPGERAVIGREILKGFMVKLGSEYSDLETRVTLIVKDTKGDPFNAAKLAESLVKTELVDLVFGPVFSDECEQVRPIAESGNIPFFSPTATDESLYRNSNWFFGLNQTLETRGKRSAEAALKIIGTKPKVQILLVAEENSDAAEMAEAFGAKLKGIKGLDLKKGFYKEGSSDIRRSIPFFRDQNEKEDPEAPTVIDLIYAPASGKDQVEMIVSQLSYIKLFGTFVGNTDWDVKSLLRNYRTQLNGMLIVKDQSVDTSRTDVKQFFKKFTYKFRVKPDELALRGADGFILVKNLLQNNSLHQTDTALRIKEMKSVSGLQSDIWFNGTNSNQYLQFFRVINNEIVPLANE